MAFWQDGKSLEPKRSYRFQLSVTGEAGKIESFLIEKVTKPGFSIGESEVKYMNHSFFYPGRVTWDVISFTVVDCLSPSSANGTEAVMKMLEKSGYSMPEAAPGGLRTISKKLSQEALGRIQIHQYDSQGTMPKETWVLNNAWIQSAKFGELSYESEDMQKVEITVRYDNAFVKIAGQANLPTNAKG
jgi:hypothetical protein